MSYVQQALLSSAYGSTLQEGPRQLMWQFMMHAALSSSPSYPVPSWYIDEGYPASFLLPNSSNRSTRQGYPTPHPN